MYNVITLPLAEEDIQSNTDYIAFEKQAPETALQLTVGFKNKITRSEAQEAFEELRRQAADVPEMFLEEINQEIADARAVGLSHDAII